jgi:hypothetical protein
MLTLLLMLNLLLDEGISPFPMTAVPQVVTPQPTPVADDPHPIGTVQREEFYILQSEAPLLVVASPPGLVEITHEQGPLMARGRFAGGDGKTETRMLLGNHLYFIDALKSGTVELIVIPVGATEAEQIQRQLVEVQAGPRPPPQPDTDTDPEPEPDGIPVDDTGGFRVLLLLDESADPDTLTAVDSLQTVKWLDANTDDWRRWDRSTAETDGELDKEEPVWRRIWQAARPALPEGPQLLIIQGKTITVRPLTSQVVQELEVAK